MKTTDKFILIKDVDTLTTLSYRVGKLKQRLEYQKLPFISMIKVGLKSPNIIQIAVPYEAIEAIEQGTKKVKPKHWSVIKELYNKGEGYFIPDLEALKDSKIYSIHGYDGISDVVEYVKTLSIHEDLSFKLYDKDSQGYQGCKLLM